jgi:RimJ/RimL family protein N-acetyltransferase
VVRLRPFTLDDVEAMVAGHDGAGSFGPTGGDLRARLRKQVERNSSLGDGGFLSLAVEADGLLVGDVQARAPKNAFPPGVCEIGITLFPDARGRGFGAEAVKLLTELLFSEGIERIQASTALDNVAMRRVLEQIGYGFEGVLRGFAPAAGDGREDYALYAATRGDWPG